MEFYISISVVALLVIIVISGLVYNRIISKKMSSIIEYTKIIPDRPSDDVSDSAINTVLADGSYERVNKLIDSLIVEAITIYYVMTGVVEETYINTKSTDEMKEYVFATVKNNMTPTILAAIKLFYNIDEDEKLNQLLLLRIKLHLIQEITEQNLPIQN